MKQVVISRNVYPDLTEELLGKLEEIENDYGIVITFFCNEESSILISYPAEVYDSFPTPGDLSLYKQGERVFTILSTFSRVEIYGSESEEVPILQIPIFEENDITLE